MLGKSRHIFIILLYLICIKPVKAESISTTDSLLKIIPTLKDTAKLDAITELIYSTGSNTGRAIEYCNLLLSEAKKQNNILNQSFALARKVQLYYEQFNNDSLFLAFNEFKEFCEAHNYYRHYFSVELLIIYGYLNQGKYILALNNAKLLYEKAKELQNSNGIIKALISMARVYYNLYNTSEAIKIQKECIPLIKKLEHPDNQLLLESYMYLCEFYEGAKKYDTLLHYADTLFSSIEKAKPAMPGFDYSQYIFYSNCCKSISYSYLGNKIKAYEYLQKAVNAFSGNWAKSFRKYLLKSQCIYYLNSNEYNKALTYVDEMIQISSDNQHNQYKATSLLRKAQILAGMGYYKEAVNTYIQINEINDSLRVERYTNQVDELKILYDLDKEKLHAAQAELKVKTFRYFIIGLIIISFFLATLVFLIYHNKNRQKQKDLVLFQRIKELNRLEAFKNKEKQIIPHTESTEDELYTRLKKLMAKEKLFTNSNLNRKILADKLNTNEAYLFETMKNHLGVTFSEYITGLRLSYAQELLSQPDSKLTVEAIAIDSGFGSRKTFHRLFREQFGLTPVEFRRMSNSDLISQC